VKHADYQHVSYFNKISNLSKWLKMSYFKKQVFVTSLQLIDNQMFQLLER